MKSFKSLISEIDHHDPDICFQCGAKVDEKGRCENSKKKPEDCKSSPTNADIEDMYGAEQYPQRVKNKFNNQF